MAEEEALVEDDSSPGVEEPTDEDEAEVQQQAEEIMADESATATDKITRLYSLGFSRKQIVDEYGFKSQTVYHALPVSREKKKPGTAMVESPIFPVTKKSEQISVENILQYLSNGDDHMRYRYEGMLMMKAAMLMVADQANIDKVNAQTEVLRIKPLLDMIAVSRQELDAAAARSRDSNLAIARAAASQAVGAYVNEIDRHIPKAPPTQPAKDMSEILPRVIGKVADRVVDVAVDNFLAKIAPGSTASGGTKQPEGWEEEVRQTPAAQSPATISQYDNSGWIAETRQAEVG